MLACRAVTKFLQEAVNHGPTAQNVSYAELLPAGSDLQDSLPDLVDFGFTEALNGTKPLFGHHLNALHRADAGAFQLLG